MASIAWDVGSSSTNRSSNIRHKTSIYPSIDWLDWLCAVQYLPYGAKIVKIGLADPEILRLRVNESGTKQNWLSWQRPLRYWKKIGSIIYIQKAFIWCKNCKNRTQFVFCLRVTTQNWLPWQRPLRNWKKWTWSRKFTQIPSIWWKDRENRSSRYWDSFAPIKKRRNSYFASLLEAK